MPHLSFEQHNLFFRAGADFGGSMTRRSIRGPVNTEREGLRKFMIQVLLSDVVTRYTPLP